MAVYMEHYILRQKYKEAQKTYEDILVEKEELFARTQPRSVRLDSERVTGGTRENTFDEYLMALERRKIEPRLDEARTIMEERYDLLMMKETEVRFSNDIRDRLYCLRVLDRAKMQKILMVTHYSRSQVYRILKEIYENINSETL